ncbi:MAG: SOS response-associated peptidase [Haloarculaceae archaeon]
MCGRTSLFAPPSALRERFDASVPERYRPRYNVAPTEPLEVLTADERDAIQRFRWGLVPSWADGDREGFINARAETAAEKPAFRDAWAERPCLVLSSGYYEWRDAGRGPTQPYRIYREDDVAFAMAGLWEPSAADAAGATVTILTTEPSDAVAHVHDRMPVVLPRGAEAEWLAAGPDERRAYCRPYPGADLDAYPVSTRVNDPGNGSPSVVEPDDTEQTGLGEFG